MRSQRYRVLRNIWCSISSLSWHCITSITLITNMIFEVSTKPWVLWCWWKVPRDSIWGEQHMRVSRMCPPSEWWGVGRVGLVQHSTLHSSDDFKTCIFAHFHPTEAGGLGLTIYTELPPDVKSLYQLDSPLSSLQLSLAGWVGASLGNSIVRTVVYLSFQ